MSRHLLVLLVVVWPRVTWPEDALPVAERIARRDFPSVFQAWNPADERPEESRERTEARHDLLFHDAGYFWLHWDHRHHGLATGFTQESLPNALRRRRRLLEANPHMVLLCEIRHRDAHRDHLPDDHDWWLRDEDGERVVGWAEGGYFLLDYHDPEFRRHVARRAAAAVRSGVFDGVMLDWWKEDDDRVALVRAVREAVGKDALILVNSNDGKSPRSAEFVNGLFMECYRSKTVEDWERIAATLRWAETNLREPRVNCVETWFEESRRDVRKMRATTTLALTHSDGYALFSDPNDLPTPDHEHDWYDFWDAPLGRPLDTPTRRVGTATVRDFENGTAVFNPPGGEPAVVEFTTERRRASDGAKGREHTVAPGDGDVFLRTSASK